MKKRITALALCAVLALAGCSGTEQNSSQGASGQSGKTAAIDENERLSPEEYRQKLLDTLKEYFDPSDAIYQIVISSFEEEETLDMSAVTPYVEDIKKYLQESREALDKFSTFTPPEKYDQKHSELLKTLENEYKLMDSYEFLNKAAEENNEDNFAIYFSYLGKYFESSEYMTKIGEIVHDLREDVA